MVDQHCPCADMTWWNLMNKLFQLCLGNTKMFTSQKIGRMVFIYFYFDKTLTHADAIDRMHVNARKNELLINFLPALILVFNKNVLQAATRETRLQMLKIEQKHHMTSCTWGRGCPTKSVIDHRTWSIIGHSTIHINHGMIRTTSYQEIHSRWWCFKTSLGNSMVRLTVRL